MDIKKHKEMMLKIAKNLTSTNIEDIKFLCADIGDSILEKIEKPTELIRALEHQGYVGVDNYDNFIDLLGNIGRSDLVKEHFLKLTEKSQSIRNEIVERIVPNGCIFKFDFKEYGILTIIDYQLISDNRTLNKLNSLSQEYYSMKEKNGMLYVKVHMSFIKDENIKFSFSFQNSKKKECAVNITDDCQYEHSYKEIIIAAPAPIFNATFGDIIGAKSLDWRSQNDRSLNKVSREELIEDSAKKYLERNISNYDDVIYFPSSSTDGSSCFVVSKLYDLFARTKGIRAVLPAYPLRCHATSLMCKLDAVEICKDENRITIFNSDLNLVLIARIADTLDCIKSESDYCLNDIVLFVNVYKSLIENKGLIIIGTVVIPLFERKLVENELFFQFPNKFDLENVFYLCKDDIEDDRNLVNWWNLFGNYCKNLKKTKTKDKDSNQDLFKQLIALTMMFMGYWINKTVDKNLLPTVESDTQKQIESLILNYEQLKVIKDNGLKKIITGGYGSGKSVVGKEIVKNCITKKAVTSFKLYYICCNHFSLFQCEMKEFVDNVKKKTSSNVTVVCDNLYDLWGQMRKSKIISEEKVYLPKLLQYLAEINNNKVDFVLEEISCEHVTGEDAVQLNILFSSVLKESLVVFIPESVEKNRKLIRDNETHLIQNNGFDKKLMEGMTVFTLKNSMRVTECNCLLIESTKEIINKNKTVSKLPNTRMNMALEKSEEFNLLGEDPNITQNNYTPPFISKEDDFSKSLLKDGESTVSNFKLTSNNFYDPDLDHMLKNIADMSNDLDPNTRIETSHCLKPGKIGHSIKGRKPKMLFLPFHDIEEITSVKVLSIILNNFCFKKSRKTVVLCSHINEVHPVAYAIEKGEHDAVIYSPHLQKYTPTYEEKSNVMNDFINSSKILVTDCKGFSGAEAESVIILVSPEEIFLRHVLVDAMSRSNSDVIILVLGSKDNKDKSVVPGENKTVGSVLNEWSENVVKKFTVQIKNDNRRLWKSDSSVYIGDKSEEFVNCGFEEGFKKSKHRIALNTKNNSIYETMAYNLQSNIKNKNETIPESRINDSILIMSTSNVLNSSNVLILSSIFQNVAQYFVGTDWSKFARILGLLDREIDMIDSVYHTTLEKSYQVLIEWRQKNGNVTWQQLKMNLESVERFDIIQKIENDFPDIVTQPESNIYQQQFTEIKTDKRFIHSIIYNQERKNHFCQLVGSDWQILGSLLSIPDYILDFIEHDLKENKDKAYEMLNYWVKLNNLSEGNQEKFTSALVQMNKLSLNEFIADFSNDDAEPIQELGLNNDFNTSDASNNGLELNAKHFDKVAYCIGSDWRRFGRYLSLTDAEIRMIDYDYHKTIDKANQILVKWRQNNGNVTWQQLKRSLKLFHRFDIIWQIENDFPDNVTRPGMTR